MKERTIHHAFRSTSVTAIVRLIKYGASQFSGEDNVGLSSPFDRSDACVPLEHNHERRVCCESTCQRAKQRGMATHALSCGVNAGLRPCQHSRADKPWRCPCHTGVANAYRTLSISLFPLVYANKPSDYGLRTFRAT